MDYKFNKQKDVYKVNQSFNLDYKKNNFEHSIQELKDQNFQFYQHNQGTCVCGKCICGQCKCRQKGIFFLFLKDQANQQEYPRTLRSIYRNDYPWRKAQSTNRKPYGNYKAELEQLNKETTYEDNYKPYKIVPLKMQKKQFQLSPLSPQISVLTQYQRDYLHIAQDKAFPIKPFDQFTNPNVHSPMVTTYRYDFKNMESPKGEYSNFAKDNAKKLHTGNSPNIFMKTTYNNFFQGEKGEKLRPYFQNQSLGPFPSKGTNYITCHKHDYIPMCTSKCPAREKLEEISSHVNPK